MSIITVGIDLAKNVFAMHGVDDNGKPVLVKPRVSREHLPALIAHLEALPGWINRCVGDLLAHADALEARIAEYDRAIG
jgi:transposase